MEHDFIPRDEVVLQVKNKESYPCSPRQTGNAHKLQGISEFTRNSSCSGIALSKMGLNFSSEFIPSRKTLANAVKLQRGIQIKI